MSVCFITAIYGGYETTCKPFAEQTIKTDFICFTDNEAIINNGWIIDTHPYHETHPSLIDDGTYRNSRSKNTSSFMKSKYYKSAFKNIPRLKDYKVVIWLDGTIEIKNSNVSKWVLDTIEKYKIISWEHDWRNGSLEAEAIDSQNFCRYNSPFCHGQPQPVQTPMKTYISYLNDGYDVDFFKRLRPDKPHFGVYVTCFVAFLNRDSLVEKFLDKWYTEILNCTQDQIGFPYVAQKTGLVPYTLPDNDISGNFENNDFHTKHGHGI
jgi:hypothetical protein